MSTKQIHVFISHAWAYSQDYDTLAKWIFEEKWSSGQASLDFRNYSVPKDDPIHNATSDEQLEQAIFNQIARSHVVVIPVGMYASYSKWIQKEIDGSLAYKKPIIAVIPRDQKRLPGVVVDSATTEVGWNKESVVTSIWNQYKSL